MKYMVIFFYFSQLCAPTGSPVSAPPYFYMRQFNTYNEAWVEKEAINIGKEGYATIVYGYSEMNDRKFGERGNL